MAKISQSLSFTFRVGQASNQYCKVNLEVSEIDTELPLDAQLEKIDNTLDVIKNLQKKYPSQVYQFHMQRSPFYNWMLGIPLDDEDKKP